MRTHAHGHTLTKVAILDVRKTQSLMQKHKVLQVRARIGENAITTETPHDLLLFQGACELERPSHLHRLVSVGF